MTLGPADSPGTVEAIMTHELHHVGMGQCPALADRERLDARQQRSVDWLSMFGEGLAVLATAGGPMQHPHFYSKPEEYLVWERDLANFHRDVSRVEAFFRAIRDGSMPEGKQRAALFEFIATEQVPQGPAYTVGWKMAAMVERHAGRDALIDSMCDQRELLKRYNEVAAAVRADGVDNLPTWSEEFLHSLYAN